MIPGLYFFSCFFCTTSTFKSRRAFTAVLCLGATRCFDRQCARCTIPVLMPRCASQFERSSGPGQPAPTRIKNRQRAIGGRRELSPRAEPEEEGRREKLWPRVRRTASRDRKCRLAPAASQSAASNSCSDCFRGVIFGAAQNLTQPLSNHPVSLQNTQPLRAPARPVDRNGYLGRYHGACRGGYAMGRRRGRSSCQGGRQQGTAARCPVTSSHVPSGEFCSAASPSSPAHGPAI